MGVLVREFQQLYERRVRGEGGEGGLEELEIQYGDYTVWQREWLQGEVLKEQLEYWRKQLEGVRVVEIPSDRRRSGVRSYGGGRERLEIGEGVTEKLKELSRREGVTLFMALLAGFQVLVSKYTGEVDVS